MDPFPRVFYETDAGVRTLADFNRCTLMHFGCARDVDRTLVLAPSVASCGDLTLRHAGRRLPAPAALSAVHPASADASSTHVDGRTPAASDADHAKVVVLAHPPRCPLKFVEPIEAALASEASNVRVGVAVLVEHRGRVLITRRSKFMRTFPSGWVVPGGHLEPLESIGAAGARELHEETGIAVDPNSLHVFAVFESAFPVFIEVGRPIRHHIVLYLRAVVADAVELAVKADPSEVGAVAWVTPAVIREALNVVGPHADMRFPALVNSREDDFGATLEGVWTERQLDIRALKAIPDPFTGLLPDERLTTGTAFLLEEWLDSKRAR